jgi:hypothetical protein
VLPLPAHHRHHRTTPFIDWANGIADVQWQETLMHIKLEDVPHCFRCRYIATVEIFFNFIGFDHIPFGGIVTLA